MQTFNLPSQVCRQTFNLPSHVCRQTFNPPRKFECKLAPPFAFKCLRVCLLVSGWFPQSITEKWFDVVKATSLDVDIHKDSWQDHTQSKMQHTTVAIVFTTAPLHKAIKGKRTSWQVDLSIKLNCSKIRFLHILQLAKVDTDYYRLHDLPCRWLATAKRLSEHGWHAGETLYMKRRRVWL